MKYQVPEEFNDYLKVMDFGIEKHGCFNFLDDNGSTCGFVDMHDRLFHHLARSFRDGQVDMSRRVDSESKLDHLLHLICRAQMMYTRLQRGIKHKDDEGN